MSWRCYYYAMIYGIVSIVILVDKLSIVVSVAFSYIVFGEKTVYESRYRLILHPLCDNSNGIFLFENFSINESA